MQCETVKVSINLRENGLIHKEKLNISIAYKDGELRKQELSLKRLQHLCLLLKLCSGNNLNEENQMICLLIYSTV
jgi:proline dehydrogenase